MVCVPYAMFDGMVRVRFSWRHMPTSPWSQPEMTWPTPTAKARASKQGISRVTIQCSYVSKEEVGHGQDWQLKRLTINVSSARSGMHTPRVEFVSIGEKGPCLEFPPRNEGLYKYCCLWTTYIVYLDTVSFLSLVGTLGWFECCFDL